MATITRNTKPGGTTSWQDGDKLTHTDLNADFDTIYNDHNGSIDGTNVAANPSNKIDPRAIDDTSDDEATQKTTLAPGDSSSQSLATDIEDEVQQLRYVAERQALSLDAVRYDGSAATTIMWGDLPARRLVFQDSFEGLFTSSSLPDGWANVTGTPTVTNPTTDVSEGKGKAIKVVGDGAGGANQGIKRTFAGLKASTRYLIVVRAKVTAGDTFTLITTGGVSTGDFQNLAASHATTTSTSYATVAGVVATDSTPTDLVVQLVGSANTDEIFVDHFQLWECGASPAGADRPMRPVYVQATTAGTAITGATTDTGLDTNYQFVDDGTTNIDYTVTCPADGYYIKVTVHWNLRETTATAATASATVRLYEDIAGGGLSSVAEHFQLAETPSATTKSTFTGSMVYIKNDPVPGSTYRYALAATKGGVGTNLIPQESNTGSSAICIEVLPGG